MKFLALDLEFTQPSEKIFHIGACVFDIHTGEIFETFSQLVKIDESLSDYIVKLCGFTDADLYAGGKSLSEAYENLLKVFRKYPEAYANMVTWGGGDSAALKKQLTVEYDKIIVGKTFDWPFGHRWLDIKTLFQLLQFAKGAKPQGGLAKAMRIYGLTFQGRAHQAHVDAENTARLAHRLFQELPRGR